MPKRLTGASLYVASIDAEAARLRKKIARLRYRIDLPSLANHECRWWWLRLWQDYIDMLGLLLARAEEYRVAHPGGSESR